MVSLLFQRHSTLDVCVNDALAVGELMQNSALFGAHHFITLPPPSFHTYTHTHTHRLHSLVSVVATQILVSGIPRFFLRDTAATLWYSPQRTVRKSNMVERLSCLPLRWRSWQDWTLAIRCCSNWATRRDQRTVACWSLWQRKGEYISPTGCVHVLVFLYHVPYPVYHGMVTPLLFLNQD